MSVETKPNKLTKGLVLDTFHTDVDNTVATYALNAQLEDQEGNHFHYGSEVGTTYIKDIPDNHVVIGHINMERNETVLFTTDGTNSTIGVLSRNDDMSYHYEIKVDDSKQTKKLGFKKEGYVRGVYRLLNGCDKVIYFVDGINKDRRININQLDSYKLPDTQSVASGIIFDDSLRATIYALSSATGNIQLIRLLSASPEATANVLANLTSGQTLIKLLEVSANGIGTAFANLMRTANIISSTNATGISTVNVDIIKLLQANVSAIGSVNAILESTQQGTVEINVTLTGTASSTAILLRTALLESNLTTEASTIATAILTKVINAQVEASSNTTVSAQITIPVSATVNAIANTTVNAILSSVINATVNATADTSATAQLSKVISTSVNALANSSSEVLIGVVLISTNIASASTSTVNLIIGNSLISSVTAEGTTTVELVIAELLSSTMTASANTTANLLVSELLASTVNGLATPTSSITVADVLTINENASATVTNATLDVVFGDPNFANVSLLLHGNGADGSTTFTDNSPNAFTVTGFGNAQINTAIKQFGTGSIKLDGNGDYLTTPDNIDYQFGTGDFTVETWVRFNSTSGFVPILANGRGASVSHDMNWSVFYQTDSIYFTKFVANVQTDFIFAWNPSINTWYHLAITRSGTSIRAYIDGNQIGSTQTSSLSFSGATLNPEFNVGRLLTGPSGSVSNFLNGYLDDVRITKGVARYTSNFTPPTAQFPDQ